MDLGNDLMDKPTDTKRNELQENKYISLTSLNIVFKKFRSTQDPNKQD